MQDLAVAACGIQLPDQGPLHWERGVSATGPPGKSPQSDLSLTLLSHRVCASLTQCCHTGFLVYACQTLKFWEESFSLNSVWGPVCSGSPGPKGWGVKPAWTGWPGKSSTEDPHRVSNPGSCGHHKATAETREPQWGSAVRQAFQSGPVFEINSLLQSLDLFMCWTPAREQKSNSGFKDGVTSVISQVPADVRPLITYENTLAPELWFAGKRSVFQLEWQRRL